MKNDNGSGLENRLNFFPCLYQTKNRQEAISLFEIWAKLIGNPDDIRCAELLRWYMGITTPECRENVLACLKESIDYLNYVLSDLDGYYTLRWKAMVSFYTKMLRRQEMAKNSSTPRDERPLDVHAARIVLSETENPERDMAKTYEVTNILLDYFTEKGFTINQSSGTVKTTKFNRKNYPDVVLPSEEDKAKIKLKYKGRYKDYNADPKGNGYQAIHFVVWIQVEIDGKMIKIPLEVQVITERAFNRVNQDESNREVNEDSHIENHKAYKNRVEGYIYAWRGEVSLIALALAGFEGIEYDFETGECKDQIALVHPIKYSIPTANHPIP